MEAQSNTEGAPLSRPIPLTDLIDAIERLGPTTIYVEADDQGRPRVLRLDPQRKVGPERRESAEEFAARVMGMKRPGVAEAITAAHDEAMNVLSRARRSGREDTERQVLDGLGLLNDAECDERIASVRAQETAQNGSMRALLEALVIEVTR